MKREYANKLMPVKSYEKGLIFCGKKSITDITNHLTAKAKGVFHNSQCQFVPRLPSILEPSRLIRNSTN